MHSIFKLLLEISTKYNEVKYKLYSIHTPIQVVLYFIVNFK